jgi:hypothetical protein
MNHHHHHHHHHHPGNNDSSSGVDRGRGRAVAFVSSATTTSVPTLSTRAATKISMMSLE